MVGWRKETGAKVVTWVSDCDEAKLLVSSAKADQIKLMLVCKVVEGETPEDLTKLKPTDSKLLLVPGKTAEKLKLQECSFTRFADDAPAIRAAATKSSTVLEVAETKVLRFEIAKQYTQDEQAWRRDGQDRAASVHTWAREAAPTLQKGNLARVFHTSMTPPPREETRESMDSFVSPHVPWRS